MKTNRLALVLSGVLLVLGLIAGLSLNYSQTSDSDQSSAASDTYHAHLMEEDLYLSQIQPILNSRCVACHACYNSPCQLDLTSYEGVRRGAFKVDTYDFPLLKERSPTRLGIDGKTVADWRAKGFFPVIAENTSSRDRESILWTLINLRQKGFQSKTEKWDSSSSRFCPNPQELANGENSKKFVSELEQYLGLYPFRGMPYGLPPLKESEIELIGKWIESGAPGPTVEVLAAQSATESELLPVVQDYEKFLNGLDFKSKLSARYIYEHLFLAHIYFEEKPGSFYRLVRARNAVGEPDEISTVRPFDDPGPIFFYRFQKYTATVVHKNHIPYALNRRKLEVWKERFLQSQWLSEEEKWPAYGNAGANPFVTFKPIPPQVRYRFLIDDAYYHVMTFIKGPVCNGAVAVSVINDHFWVLFMNPESDVTVTKPEFFAKNAHLMALPANFPEDKFQIDEIGRNHEVVNQSKYELYKKVYPQGLDLSAIWDGDGFNRSALLTVYRHHDSATVLRGAHGQVPKTVWVLDYPIFEDIYYNLVAAYNVYGPILHQVTTRLHMDHSRVNAQDLFLTFLPLDRRMQIRSEWTQKVPVEKFKLDVLFSKLQEKSFDTRLDVVHPYVGRDLPAKLSLQSKDEKNELLQKIFAERLADQVRGPVDSVSGGVKPLRSELPTIISDWKDVAMWFSSVSGFAAPFARYLPDAAYVRVTLADGSRRAFTLVHNKEHYNVSFLFFEESRRRPELDSINFVQGFAASYPNMYFDVTVSEIPEFIALLKSLGPDSNSWKRFVTRFGVIRSSENFWAFHDWLNQEFKAADPVEGAILDLNRYMGDQ